MAPKNISAFYKNHPLRNETIIKRVQRELKSLDSISELDLAFDPQGATTHQNHVGGMGFTVALARATFLNPSMHILDLGFCLGGSIRLLSYLNGCKATIYDDSWDRIAEAKDLAANVDAARRLDVY